MKCQRCDKKLSNRQKKYCSKSCSAFSTSNPSKLKKHRACPICSVELTYEEHKLQKYCGAKCKTVGLSSHKRFVALEDLLIEDSPARGDHLKTRLLNAGLLRLECYECGITSWRGKIAPLQLDHINGKNRDHRLENLRILCANCHAQTDTFCGRNHKNRQ